MEIETKKSLMVTKTKDNQPLTELIAEQTIETPYDEFPSALPPACKSGIKYVKAIHITVWQDKERIWLEVDRVYATRYDCMSVPERVRQAA